MCDINAFAPRNYNKMKKALKKTTLDISVENKRAEINGTKN